MSDEFMDRTTCEECGEELWGHSERHGLCTGCQLRGADADTDGDYRDEDYDD